MEIFERYSFGYRMFDTGLSQAYRLYANIKKHNNIKFRRLHHQLVVMSIELLVNEDSSCVD